MLVRSFSGGGGGRGAGPDPKARPPPRRTAQRGPGQSPAPPRPIFAAFRGSENPDSQTSTPAPPRAAQGAPLPPPNTASPGSAASGAALPGAGGGSALPAAPGSAPALPPPIDAAAHRVA